MGLDLPEHVAPVHFYRFKTDLEFLRDAYGRHSLRDQAKHLYFTCGQVGLDGPHFGEQKNAAQN